MDCNGKRVYNFFNGIFDDASLYDTVIWEAFVSLHPMYHWLIVASAKGFAYPVVRFDLIRQ